MTNSTAVFDRYRSASVETMSPARMIIALYDRLLLDLDRAVAGIESDNLVATHAALVHAQDILGELHDSLDVSVWAPGEQLADLYRFLIRELITANLDKNAAKILECRSVVQPLRDAWNDAASLVPGSGDRSA
jgi:flagellar secretion chaperone FliS